MKVRDILERAVEEGRDPHTALAVELFQVPEKDLEPYMRNRAKAIAHVFLYGGDER